MLVRAKRLVFTEVKPVLSDRKWRASTPFGDYEILESGGNFSCYYRNGFITHAATLESAQTACQSDFDRRWREATEVPDLVWEKCTRPNGSYFLRCNQSGVKYRVGEDSIGVYASIDDGGKSDITDLRIPKTEADAIAACNAHNRAAVLGE